MLKEHDCVKSVKGERLSYDDNAKGAELPYDDSA